MVPDVGTVATESTAWAAGNGGPRPGGVRRQDAMGGSVGGADQEAVPPAPLRCVPGSRHLVARQPDTTLHPTHRCRSVGPRVSVCSRLTFRLACPVRTGE